MAGGGDDLALLHSDAAGLADLIAGVAVLGAGGILGTHQLGVVAGGGQRLGLGIRVGPALQRHRGGVRPDTGALAAGLGGHLAGHRSGQRLGMASVTGAGKDSLGSEAGPLPHGLTPDVSSGGQRLSLGIRIGLAFEGHRGGVRPDAGALAAGLGGHLTGHRSGQRLGMGPIIAAGERGGGGLRSGPGPGRLTPGVAGGRNGQSLQGGLVLAVGVAEQLPADGALPIRLGTGGFAGGGHLRHGGEGMAVGAGIGGAVGHGHVVDGEHGVGIVIALVGLLIEVEGELGIVRAEGGGNGNMGRAHEPITAYRLQIGCGPDGGPGLAAVGGGLHGHGAVVADDRLEQQVIKGQGGGLAGQVHHGGDEILILQLVAAAGHRQQGLADAADAPGITPGIFIVIHVDAGLLGGIELGIGALVPGIGAVGTGALHGPAVAGEVLGLEVVVELHVGGRPGEHGGNGVVGGDILKGVAVHRAHALAVHQHIGDGVTLLGGDGEGLGRALLHGHLTGGGDGAALTGGGGDGVLLGHGAVLHRHQLHVVDGQRSGVLGAGIVEGELDAVHRILGRDLDLSAAGNGIAAGFLAGIAVLEVPDGGPGLAAVGGGLHGGGEGLVLDAVNAVGIVEIQNAIPGAGQVHGRGDQPLVLRAAVPVVGDIGLLGVVAQALPVVIGILLPGVAVGVDALQGPAVEGEAVAGDGLEVVLEHHGGDIGDLLKYGGNGVALIHGQGQDIAGNGGGAAVDLHVGQLIALVRGEGNVHGLAGDIGGLTGGGHGTAVGGGGGQGHGVAGRLGLLEGGGDGVIHAHPLEGIVADGAQIRAVHVDVDDLIALGGGDVEGLAGTLLHQGLTGGGDGSALTGGGGDGHIVVPLLGVQLNVVQRQVGAALAGVNKGEAQVLAVLQALGNVDLGLGLGPGGEQAGIPLQVPDLLPGGAAVAGGHDLEVAVLILHGVPIGGVEVKHHVDLGIHAADIRGAGDQPLVLLVVVVIVHGGRVVLVAVPGVQRAALALDAPVVGEPLLVEVLGPEDVSGRDGAVIVGVALGGDGIHLGVAGVVVDDHAEGLAEAGDVILADMAGDAGLQLAEALHAIEHLAVLDVVEHHGRHILVIGHVQAQVIPALGLGDLQIVGMRLLGVDGDGEGPGVLLVGPHAVAIGQGGLDGHGSLGVVGQLGVVGVGAVPGLDAVIFGVHTGGHNAVIVVAVDGLAHILAVLAVVHLAVGAGDGILQALGVAQQAGVDTGEAVHEVIVVGRDGVAVRQIRHAGVVVVTQVGVHRVLAGGGEGGVHIGLGLAGGAVQSLPVIGGVHDGGLGPVAVEGQEGHAQINGIHLGQGHEALHIAAVGELGQHRPALVGDGDGDGDIGGLAGSHGHAVILAVGGEGVGQQPGASADGGELLLIAVDVALGGVRQDDGGHVVIQGVTAGVVNGEGHGIHALHSGIVLQLQLARHGQITPGIHGVVEAHQAGALLAGRIGHAVVVIDHMGGAHEQGIGHVLAVRAGHRGIAGLQGLLDDGHAARHMGGGHGGAVHALIAAGHGGIDARAGGGELRLQGQLGGGAPAGEIGHAVGGRLHQGVGRSHGQGLGLLLLHVFTGGLGDKRAGDLPVGDGHVQHAGDVVVHQHANGAGVGGVALLLLIVHAAAPLHQGDLAGQVQARIVLLRAVVGNHHILDGAPGGQAAEGLGVLVVADGGAVLIGQVLAAHGDIGAVDHAVGHSGHGQGLAIGRGLADQAVIGVGGQGLAAEGVAIGGVIGVAGGHSQGHAALAGALEHVQQALGEGILAVIVDVAAVGAQAQVGHVHAQQDAVLQGGQNIGIGRAAAALEHVHVDDLGLGRHAHDGIVDAHITGGGGGHMGAVAALFAGIAVLILVAVVELEGNLGAVVQVGHADALDDALHLEIIGLQQGPELFLGQGGALGRGLEHLVAHVHAGIQNGHQHSLAGKAGGVIAAAADHPVAVGGVGQQLKGGGNEGGLDAVQLPDGLVLAIGHCGGKAVEQGGILPLGLHPRVNGPIDLGQGALLRAQQGVDLGPGIRVSHGVVDHHDDLDFVAVVELGGVFHLDSFAVLLAAAQDLAGDIVGDTIQRRLVERGVGLVRSRLGEGCHRQGGQDHQNRQGQCAAPFDSCHLVPPISVSRTPCIKVWRTLCIVPSFAVQRNNAMCANIPPKICGFREKSGSGHSLPPTAVRCSSFRKLKIFSRYSRQSGGTFPVFSLDNRSRDRI